ncbi:aldehyde dehydrogenase family protein [Solirubrobacter sp. CPCC 204708]|uniref:Aldehyde dehydrogenase family protein n=1 Tax=Solirubrobacter deserti TaxID=2282478 RepID=A0ABT4RR14_9ACTN|nr:aldehyde dehydrogenase family protein [Solirubrobacter deserti]MBE2320474.1 aldehyde dehydrogenase family protein [Solirubrobacter deserti]MDA0140721.1 aldehyde dehydrogenase family protein [Solirubrobacter deserti]
MSTQTIESRSPQDQSDVVVSAPAADREAVAAAFKRAREAQQAWKRNAVVRADALSAAAAALDAAKDQVVDLMVREVGKPVTESVMEHGRAVRILRYQAQAALDPDGDTLPAAPPADMRTLLLARRRPRGVAGLITPWNFPFAIPLWKAAPALAYGNAVVLKPSTDALACALLLEELLGGVLPEGLFNVVSGEAEAGQAVIEQADVVSFTGSTGVGLQVAQAATARGIASQAEMGGLNASIVLPDADVEAAAKVIAGAAMGYAGQKCTATGRVLVLGDTAEFTDALAAAVDGLAIGDPKDEGTIVGPVINAPAREKLVAAAEGAPGDGGRVVTGGKALDGPGLLFAPTVVDGQQPTARLAQEEVFGPIVTVLKAESAEQAVEISNSVPYGLVTSVFTSDLDSALTVVDGLETGMIRVNMPTSGVDFHAPFGGEKQSSFGPREQGKAARELYTTTHTITIGPAS